MVDELEYLTASEECCGRYSLTEFKEYLKIESMSSDRNCEGWVFWMPEGVDLEPSEYVFSQLFGKSIQERIRLALDKKMSEKNGPRNEKYVAQFWAPKVATLDQPFAVGCLDKGLCWYRMQSMNHSYVVENGVEEEELGPPGRVFRNGHPESTPDLRLYSIKQFPLRDQATRFGFTIYLALPVFDLYLTQCVGVLEVVSTCNYRRWGSEYLFYQEALKAGEMRSTLCSSRSFFGTLLHKNKSYKLKPRKEIGEMLELAVKALPQLHLAQVWVPCKKCALLNINVNCMERLSLINAVDGNVNVFGSCDANMQQFLEAGEFHNVQIGKGITGIVLSSTNKLCFCRNLSELSIIEYPLAHYAQKASLSFGFSVCLRSEDNGNDHNLYIFEFYLHSHITEDAQTWSFLHLLLKIMEMKLKGFKVASGRQLGDELIVEVRNKNMLFQYGQANQHQHLKEYIMVMPMGKCEKNYSIPDFKAFLQEADLSCFQAPDKDRYGWLFCGSKVSVESEVNNNSLLLPNTIQEKIRTLFRAMKSKWVWNNYCLVQFWAPKMIEGKSCLSTSDQPFALGYLCKGLCSYRKQCMEHHYFIGEGAKEEAFGPPGRVFRSGHPESSPDLRLYSIKEFPLRDHAAHRSLRRYLALPVFDLNQKQCVGILELLEYGYHRLIGLNCIGSALEVADLRSTHIPFQSGIQAGNYKKANAKTFSSIKNDEGQEQALNEIQDMLELAIKTPQLSLAQVWVPCIQCANLSPNIKCMKRAMFKYDLCLESFNNYKCMSGMIEFLDLCNLHQVQIGKGVAGMVLESENRPCFCQNLCDFSITEQPLVHYAHRARLDICFAICLKSSYSWNNIYVLEFFLNSAARNIGYPQSLFVLLQIMKQKCKSFKVASGQQLGEELIVDVIQSCKENKHFESTYPDMFPIRFNIIQYSQEMEHKYSRNEQVHCDSSGTNSVMNIAETERSDIGAGNTDKELTTNKSKEGRKKTGFHIDHGDLEPHFGKRLQDVARELGVSKSTVKRACRRCGIERWPNGEQNKRNPSLVLKENAVNRVQDGDAETSISSGGDIPPLDLALHQNRPHPNTEGTQQLANLCPDSEADVMTLKAKFKDDTIKIQLRLTSGMAKLMEEVSKRLNLKIGSFKLKYLDEDDDDWILLACDDDLQLCLKNLTALGRITRSLK